MVSLCARTGSYFAPAFSALKLPLEERTSTASNVRHFPHQAWSSCIFYGVFSRDDCGVMASTQKYQFSRRCSTHFVSVVVLCLSAYSYVKCRSGGQVNGVLGGVVAPTKTSPHAFRLVEHMCMHNYLYGSYLWRQRLRLGMLLCGNAVELHGLFGAVLLSRPAQMSAHKTTQGVR